ncbi:hypothetical protein K0504_08485 [Neiella marina]|uniref:Uncharacterized protein n=1 Tax=Neiella holothuriorum TaxID=2870530 RepID=A0ABS7EFH3_9GAMM|nr:hypothetical protein [Neiella holothuriorum]MBW8191068.1 hypothetical protein [Neiella holothuriorum]
MNTLPFIALISGVLAAPAVANQYSCTLDGATRLIEVAYHSSDSTLPCEVIYKKEDGTISSLWRAQNQQGYCEEQASLFADKQSSWGWNCKLVEPAVSTADN